MEKNGAGAVAVFGPRDLPGPQAAAFASRLKERLREVRPSAVYVGGAEGVDAAGFDVARAVGIPVVVFVPWKDGYRLFGRFRVSFGGSSVVKTGWGSIVAPPWPKDYWDVAVTVYPALRDREEGVRALMHRNVAVLKGLPPEFPPPTLAFYYGGGRGGPGTRHALAVAEYLRIPAVDLSLG